MGWQAGKGGRILVQPNGTSAAVSITRTSGASTTVYSDQARTSSVAMPNTIATPTVYWLDGDDSYTVSCKVSGIECAKAGTTVGAVAVYIGGGSAETVTVDVETAQGSVGVSGSYLAKDHLIWDVTDHGVLGDVIELSDAMMVGGTTTLTSASANFTAADIGKKVAVKGVNTGGSDLTTSNNQITAVTDANTVTIQKAAVVSSVAARSVADGAITIATQTLTSATAAFTAGDVGKTVTVTGAGETGRRIMGEQFSMTAASPTLTAKYACFTAAMVGQKVKVAGAGASGASLVATISSRSSSTVVTLDTNASTTVATALVQAWTVADLVTWIVAYTNATTVSVQTLASATVSGASVAIGGHTAAYGTDDVAAILALIGLVGSGATLYWPVGKTSLLGQGTVDISKPVTFKFADRNSGGLHLGATSGRVKVLADNVTFDNAQFKALVGGTTDLFALRSGANFKNWRFLNCKWNGVRSLFQPIGALQDDGTVLATAPGFSGQIYFLFPEITANIGDGMHFDTIDGIEMISPWFHHNGITAGATGGWQLKFANGCKGKVIGGLAEWGGKDGIDLYDSAGMDVSNFEARHNANIGVSAKWVTNQQYDGNGRNRLVGVRTWNNNSGAQINIHRGLELGIHSYANTTYGVRLANAADTNSTSDPSIDTIIANIVAVGNDGNGVQVSGGALHALVSSIQAHNNGNDGLLLDCVEAMVCNVQAFNNFLHGVELTSASSKNQLVNVHSQDANGVAIIAGTSNLINGYAEEATGIGATPNAANYPVGAFVLNTSDSTKWRRGYAGFVAA